jgi:hypothetical protein
MEWIEAGEFLQDSSVRVGSVPEVLALKCAAVVSGGDRFEAVRHRARREATARK